MWLMVLVWFKVGFGESFFVHCLIVSLLLLCSHLYRGWLLRHLCRSALIMSSLLWSSFNALASLWVRLFVLLDLDLELFSFTWFSNDSIKVLMVWWAFGGAHFLLGCGLKHTVSSLLSIGRLFVKRAFNLNLHAKFEISLMSRSVFKWSGVGMKFEL